MYYYRFGSGIDECLGDSGRNARAQRVTDTCNNALVHANVAVLLVLVAV